MDQLALPPLPPVDGSGGAMPKRKVPPVEKKRKPGKLRKKPSGRPIGDDDDEKALDNPDIIQDESQKDVDENLACDDDDDDNDEEEKNVVSKKPAAKMAKSGSPTCPT